MPQFNTKDIRPQASTSRRRPSSLATSGWQLATLRAFTLIELLIVLAIIGVVVALGVPLFGVLTGVRSVEAGRNVVAATLGQARTVAVNEGKYAGVMFYVDPATERTAMSIVVVTDPQSSNEDADPYDKYKGWVTDQPYYSGKLDNNQKIATRADRVIGLAADADATYRAQLYPQTPTVSNYLSLFGNYRPTVRSYRCLTSHDNSADDVGNRPPRNGPYGYPGAPIPQQYQEPTGGPKSGPSAESTQGPFANNLWGYDDQSAITRFSTGEQTLLPRGVGVQLMIQPVPFSASKKTPPDTERYVRTGVIMFDPQGRLVVKNFSLDQADTLGQALLLKANAQSIASAVGLALYDTSLLKGQTTFKASDSDGLYQPSTNNIAVITAPINAAFNDYSSLQDEMAEETWLDANATPLVINRYTGSLSDAQ